MTISSESRKTSPYIGAGSTGPYTFAFKVFQASDVRVTKAVTSTGAETALALTTDYTASLNADQNSSPGGSITLVAALAVGHTLVISSQVDLLQGTDLTNQGGFYPSVITDALDKITIQTQQLHEQLSRSATLPITSTVAVATLVEGIVRIASSANNLDTVADSIANVNIVALDLAETVSEINTVATDIANVNTVATDIANVNTVASDLNEGVSEINTVATSIGNVNTVGAAIANVNTVATDIANVNTVADSIANVNTCASNIAAITAAPTHASNAATSATTATTQATAAASASVAVFYENIAPRDFGLNFF